MLNENIAAGKWKELKGKVQAAWGKITDDELEATKGNLTEITGLVQKHYGTAQEEVRRRLNDWMGGDRRSA